MTSLREIASALGTAGATFTLEVPGSVPLHIGARPQTTRVTFHSQAPVRDLERGDLLAVCEAYLGGRIDVEGDFGQVVRLADVIAPGPSALDRLRMQLKLLLLDRRTLQRRSIAFHYDRPPEFFLPWFERWRSYSHGLYDSPDDTPEDAQERKLARAVEALGLVRGMRVLDMGCGWGAFLEYAGLRGISVHGITISHEQRRFVERLIRDRDLPCSVERVDLLDLRPTGRYDGAVFMGTFEHFTDYPRAAGFLATHLRPGARVWADFCSERSGFQVGRFLERHIFPGTAEYVNVPRLISALIAEGFNIHELVDDTRSYALTCRDWATNLERERKTLAERFDEASVRAFQIYLRASQHFLETNQTQAYHLVAGREPRGSLHD